MDHQYKTKEELIRELEEVQHKYNSLEAAYIKDREVKEQEKQILEKLIHASGEFIVFQDNTCDYAKILDNILAISGAKYASFNIFDREGLDFTSVSISGIKDIYKNAMSFLGFDPVNKHWKHDPFRAEMTKDKAITRFDSLHQLTRDVISKNAVHLLEKTFSLGETYVVKIAKDNQVLGDFTLIFQKNETLLHPELVKLYSNQVGVFLDRNRITNALRDSESRYASMTSNISDVIGIVSPDGTLKYLSPNLGKLFGWDPRELLGKSSWSKIHPDDDVERIQVEFAALAEKDNSTRMVEFRSENPDGSYLPIELTATNLINDPVINGILVNYHDNTERLRIQQTIRENEKFLKETQIIAGLGSYRVEIASGQWVSSEALDTIFGIPADFDKSVEGWVSVIHPEWQETMSEYFAKEVVGKKTRFDKEYKIIRQNDHAERWVHGVGRLEFNKSCHPVAMIGTIRDITERRQSEEALKESELKYRQLIENFPDAIAIYVDGRIALVNKECLHLMAAKSAEELIGKPVFQFVHPDYRSKVLARMKKVVEEGVVLPLTEEKFVRLDGSEVDVEVKALPLTLDHKPAVQLIVRDITERRRIEQALSESEAHYRLLTEGVYDVVWKQDRNNYFTYVSPSDERMRGYQAGEVVGRHVSELLTDEGKAVVKEKLLQRRDVEKSGELSGTLAYEVQQRCKDGSLVWTEVLSTAEHDEHGVITGYHGISRDITARKQAKDILQQTRQNYESFFNTIDEFLFVLDEKGNIIHTNTTVCDRLGYLEEELIGKSVLSVHPPDRREEAGRIVVEMLNGLTEFCPVPLVTKSGVQIPVETRVKHGVWDGKPVIFGVTKDISRIRLSEEKFSKLFHLNPSACGLSDLYSQEYLEVNEAFYSLLGFEKNEVIGKSALELGIFTDETRQLILLYADSKGNITQVEADLKAKNGEIIHVLLSSENIFVQDKEYRFTVVYDITERKRAEDKLKKSELNFRELFEANTDGITIFLIEPHSSQTHIVDMNENAARMLGYTKEEMMKINPDDLEKDITVEKIGKRKNELLSKGFSSFETILRHKEGHDVYVEIKVMVVNYNDQFAIMNIARDITDRKKSEFQLQKYAAELSKQNVEKDKFFSIIAHDLRSPFNVFLGLTEIMAEGLPNMTLTEMQKMVLEVRSSASRLFSLLGNLLDWSSMQRGLTTFSPSSFMLLPKISESMMLAQEAAGKKGIAISNDIADNLKVFADENMFEGVIRNLVANAVKFTPQGGTIKVSAKKNSHNSVEVCIHDTGIGMNEDILTDLFRLDRNTKRKGTEGESSTGLGLIICKDFVNFF